MNDALPSLCQSSIDRLADAGVDVPRYARSDVAAGVVHLGLGAFHRALQAVVFDDLLRKGDMRWGVLAVATRSVQLADTLARQDGLYAVKFAGTEGELWRMIGSILQLSAARREPQRIHAAIANAATRWLTLTVTEKGYDPLLADLLLGGLQQRRAAGLEGLTIASCDNLSHNGDKLKALLIEHCKDDALAQWLQARCRFPNSMVDRIVPAGTARCATEAAQVFGVVDRAALFTEKFWEWAIEDDFVDPSDGPLLARAGVTVVADVSLYENAKLRMLNGSHSALACVGAVMGLSTVFEAVSDAAIRRFLHGLMSLEVMPNLARPSLDNYRDSLLERFANPAIQHSLHQIASDSSKKISLRWVPSILAQLQSGGSIKLHAFAAAAWMRYCRGQDEAAIAYSVDDPQAQLLTSIALREPADVATATAAFLQIGSIWGNVLPGVPEWTEAVTNAARDIHVHGIAAALQRLLAGRVG